AAEASMANITSNDEILANMSVAFVLEKRFQDRTAGNKVFELHQSDDMHLAIDYRQVFDRAVGHQKQQLVVWCVLCRGDRPSVHQAFDRAVEIGAANDAAADIAVGYRADQLQLLINHQSDFEGGVVDDPQSVEYAGLRPDENLFE
ncbi:MAG TPA: hypothetical protein PLR50_07780, partial [Candidatus Rifleibacterium sp.]|nr:hypothetical protein [Candidatus Rifleibacterium sp.]